MRVGFFQFAPKFGEPENNIEAIARACDNLNADLIVLPELCTTGYQFRNRKEVRQLAEAADGSSLARFSEVAAGFGGVLALGFAERAGEKFFNSAALVSSQGVIGLYRKVHLFADEKSLFDPGDLGFGVFRVNEVLVGLMICFDWLFPESARSLALAGAAIIAHPANLVLPYCQAAMVTRALENHVFTITANRTGEEERLPGKKLQYTGASRIVGPKGNVIAEASPSETRLVCAEFDASLAKDKQITPQNHLFQDRRPDWYRLG